jgi:hypothetical protein
MAAPRNGRRRQPQAIPVDQARLDEAYAAWPGTAHDKTTLQALLLRIRVERLARQLPPTVIAAPRKKLHVARRLMLAVGAPALTTDQRAHRLRVVQRAVAAYRDICNVLHARNPNLRPPLADTIAWAEAVTALEAELASASVSTADEDRYGGNPGQGG